MEPRGGPDAIFPFLRQADALSNRGVEPSPLSQHIGATKGPSNNGPLVA